MKREQYVLSKRIEHTVFCVNLLKDILFSLFFQAYFKNRVQNKVWSILDIKTAG